MGLGYHGLACVIAVAWDTGFSPVDVRSLAARHRAVLGGRLIFDREIDGRTKTGRAAIGTLSARTEPLVTAYSPAYRSTCIPTQSFFARDQEEPTAESSWRTILRLCAPTPSLATSAG